MDVIQFLSAFGLGAIVTALVQAWLSHRSDIAKRNFQEKKEAYVGFLDAMYRSEIECSEKAALHVGHWQARIELVGSKSVIHSCLRIAETNPTNGIVHPERPQVIKALRNAVVSQFEF